MEHITTLSLHIEPQSSGEHPSWQPSFLGPMLQSVLMEHLDDDYAAQLHASTFNPYSQYCFVGENGEIIWRVSALTDEAAERLVGPASRIDSFTLRNLNETFTVRRRQFDSFGVDHLLGILKSEAGPTFRVRFATPHGLQKQRPLRDHARRPAHLPKPAYALQPGVCGGLRNRPRNARVYFRARFYHLVQPVLEVLSPHNGES